MVAFYPFGLPNVNAAGPPAHILPEVVKGVPNNLVKPLLQGVLPGYNVNVSNLVGDESEVSIDVNPTNLNNQVIVGHAPDFTTMNTFFTQDGGQNWTLVALGNRADGLVSDFRFDPTVAFDDYGNVYVAYGARTVNTGGNNQRTVVVCRSVDGGETYLQPCTHVNTNPDIGTLPGNDKWMLATGPDPDPFTPTQQNVYIAWTQNVMEGTIDQQIVLSASTDGGTTFSYPPVIVNDGSITGTEVGNLFADPAVGPNGEVYVAWHHINAGIINPDVVYVDVSLDGGASFGTDNLVTTSDTDFKTLIPAAPDRGVHVGPTIDVDRSGEYYNGRLYITYTDIGAGGLPDTDIFVRFSDDMGTTWSDPPTLVNDDSGTNSQFLPWLDVDQLTGLVTTVWYDARNDPDNKKVEVFMGVSADGGVSFQPNILVSDAQSDQSEDNRKRTLNNYLEYIGIATFGCMAFPVWADNSTKRKDLDFFTDQVILVRDFCLDGDIPIDVDIKPRNDPNSINPTSNATIPVAILTTDDFVASTVVPVSVAFGPYGAEAHGRRHIKDADGDGDLDLVLHFNVQETGIACGDTSASLTGVTFDGQTIEGSDSIRTVGCGEGP